MVATQPDRIDHNVSEWRRQTEFIICCAETVFALVLFILYNGAGGSGDTLQGSGLTVLAVTLFPVLCLARLAYVHFQQPGTWFGWVSGIADILFLSAIIYIFSMQYGTHAASLHAPTFVFYFVLIALHAMRFDAKLVAALGTLSLLAWMIMVGGFVFSGAERTSSYVAYFSSTALLVGAEVEKMFGLAAFTAIVGLSMMRASRVLRDATARQVAEVKLAEAEKASLVKTEFLANMSHEIRTPMNGVLGMTQILRTTDLSAEQGEFVDTIQRSGDALLTIINDILDFSKIEAGKLRLDKTAFNLREACEDVTTLLGVTARQKNIELIMNFQTDVPTALIGDAGRLRQILTNLIGNAIKFTEKGHVLVDVRGVELDGRAQLSFRVEDTGIGIPDEMIQNIFSKFAQVDGSTTRQFGGTGLGLAISQSLVELMGGTINVSSKMEEGSVFSFTVEMLQDRRQAALQERPEAVSLARVPILIVDDLAVNRDILKRQLEQLGARPDVVSNARDAVATIVAAHKADRPYAMVITDYQMPDIDGLKLVRALRERTQFDPLQVLVLSSIDSVDVKRAFNALDIVSYMTKPCRARDLEDSIYRAAAKFSGILPMTLADDAPATRAAS